MRKALKKSGCSYHHSIRMSPTLLWRIALFAVVLHLDSCSLQEKAPQIDPFAAINPFQKYNPFAPATPLTASVVSQWEQQFSQPGFLTPGDYWHTRQGRNELVYRLIFIADYRFFRYEGDLTAGRAAGDTIIDMAVLGLTSAAALTPYAQASRILAAISGGLVGSRAALQRNFFQYQTTTVLLDRMRALRQERFNQIVANLQLPYQQYPVELAIIEVFDYFNRGTMLGALQDISNNTAIKQINAAGGEVSMPSVAPPVSTQIRVSLPQSLSAPVPHLNIVRLAPDVRRRRKALGDAVASLEKNQDVSTASKILENFGVIPAPQGEAAIGRLRDLVASVQSEKDLIPLEHAFATGLGQSSEQNTRLPQTPATPTPSPTPTPTPSATPASPPIPLSTPKDISKPNGSLGG
jgi:hypothetical protein